MVFVILASSGPSSSLFLRTSSHSGSCKKAPNFCSRSVRDSHSSIRNKSLFDSPITTVQNPTCLIPCFSNNRSASFSKRFSRASRAVHTRRRHPVRHKSPFASSRFIVNSLRTTDLGNMYFRINESSDLTGHSAETWGRPCIYNSFHLEIGYSLLD